MSAPEAGPAPPAVASHGKRAAFDRGGVIGGLIAIAFGLLAIREGLRYATGSLLRMGPGYFPIVMGVILAALGLLLLVLSVRRPADPLQETFLWRPLLMIPIAIAFFGIAISRFGLAPATFGLVFLSSLSERKLDIRPTVLLALAMTAFVWIIFSLILSLPYPLFVW